jgi:hypothetical protein
VSCGWNSQTAKITVYMTRMPDLAAAYAGAKASLVEAGQAVHPVLVSDGIVQVGGVSWLRAEYKEDNAVRSDIWMADLHGWLLLYRATYPEADAAGLSRALDDITGIVRASAGARLDLCAKTQPPERKGRVAKDEGPAGAAGLMAVIAGAAAGVEPEKGAAQPPEPIVFCVEAALPAKDRNLLLWRGVTARGEDARVDQVTAMTVDAPPALQIAHDETLSLISSELASGRGVERWVASMHNGGRTVFFANFDGRPSEKLTAPLMRRILDGKAQPLGSYSAGDKTITINTSK